jgi:hypothetical protein
MGGTGEVLIGTYHAYSVRGSYSENANVRRVPQGLRWESFTPKVEMSFTIDHRRDLATWSRREAHTFQGFIAMSSVPQSSRRGPNTAGEWLAQSKVGQPCVLKSFLHGVNESGWWEMS